MIWYEYNSIVRSRVSSAQVGVYFCMEKIWKYSLRINAETTPLLARSASAIFSGTGLNLIVYAYLTEFSRYLAKFSVNKAQIERAVKIGSFSAKFNSNAPP